MLERSPMNHRGRAFALCFAIATLCAPLGCASSDDAVATAEVEEELGAADALLQEIADELDPDSSSFEGGSFERRVGDVDVKFVALSLHTGLTPAWKKKLDVVRESYEDFGDPERPGRFADVLDAFRIMRGGKVVGYTANFGTYQGWSREDCEEDCQGTLEYSRGERVYFTSRKREVARSEWER